MISIDSNHQLHFAININDYYLRLETWEELMMFSFTKNKQNYYDLVQTIYHRQSHLIVHILEHMKRFKKKEFRFAE